MPTPRIGLVLHPRRDPGAVAETIVRWARAHGTDLLVRPEDAGRVPEGVEVRAEDELAATADALVSLGGDGTMLGALRLAAARPVPVLGVNLGRLGFLVEVEPEGLDDALDRLESGDYTVEEHGAVVLGEGEGEAEAVAFNDVALARVPGEGAVHAALSVSGRPSGRYRCDALVMATPIGSTAYSYAAGGPVVSPLLDALIVTAAAPMGGISHPVVISAQEPLELTLQEDGGRPAVEVDGTLHRRAGPGDALHVRYRPDAGLVVRVDPERHRRRTQLKLSLLDLPFLPEEMRDLVPGAENPEAAHWRG